jgi:hypothetical protein
MRRRLAVLLAVATVGGAIVILQSTGPALGATTGVFTGSGTIGPNGVPGPSGGTASNSNVNWSGTWTLSEGGLIACSFNGAGTDSFGAGTGSGSMTCNGTTTGGMPFSRNCSLDYTRTVQVMMLTGDCGGSFSGTLDFMPNNTNPTTSFQLVGTFTTDIGTVPTTVPTVTTSTLPPLPGGPALASDACTSNLVFDGGAQGLNLKLLVQQTGSAPTTTKVCVRVESNGQGVGGRLDIVGDTLGTPSLGVPTTDNDGDACWTTTGNTVPGSHPAFHIDAPARLYVDAFRNATETWVCIDTADTDVRLKFTHPSGGGGGIPTFTWYPDPGTPG